VHYLIKIKTKTKIYIKKSKNIKVEFYLRIVGMEVSEQNGIKQFMTNEDLKAHLR
jgi:hypothetical protein